VVDTVVQNSLDNCNFFSSLVVIAKMLSTELRGLLICEINGGLCVCVCVWGGGWCVGV